MAAEIYVEVERLSNQYQFFHWHLAFPEVFRGGGFDCVLGNPPWERVKLQEKEWFAERSPEIANAPNAAARKRLIEALASSDPERHAEFVEAVRQAEAESHFLRNSGVYPLCGRGDINVYAVFAESMAKHINGSGFVGAVLPTGIATDETTKFFFQKLVDTAALVSFYDFWNRKQIFPGVQAKIKFCLLTFSNIRHESFSVAAQLEDLVMLNEAGRVYKLTPEDVRRINPNTRNCPTFISNKDAEINRLIYARVPIISKEGDVLEDQWDIEFSRMFDMTNEARLFRTFEDLTRDGFRLSGNRFQKDGKTFIALYEAKLAYQYDHRAATFEGVPEEARFRVHAWANETTDEQHINPDYETIPRFWIDRVEVRSRSKDGASSLFSFRNTISAVADSRSLVASLLPVVGVGNSLPVIYLADARATVTFMAAFNSFALDYLMRQKASGGNLNYYIVKQLPLPAKATMLAKCGWSTDGSVYDWLVPRVLELTYTAWDLEPFAQQCGWQGPPFVWNPERRFLARCELDAAFFHLYLGPENEWRTQSDAVTQALPTARDVVSYLLDTFPIVRRQDEERFNGEYRTKRLIIEIYDLMAEAIRTGRPYQTRLDPPPGDPRCCHPPRNQEVTVAV